jgi:hypothetical protein
MTIVRLKDLRRSLTYDYFEGSQKECEIVKKVLDKYHESDTGIEIEIVTIKPTYKSLDEFFSVNEYKYTFEMLNKISEE